MGSSDRHTLSNVIELFNAPLGLSQAWALAYSIADTLKQVTKPQEATASSLDSPLNLIPHELSLDNITLSLDGSISFVVSNADRRQSKSIAKLIHSLGKVIYEALDYGVPDNEERDLPAALEDLIDRMTYESNDILIDETDEGISDENDECSGKIRNGIGLLPADLEPQITSFSQIMRLCSATLPNPHESCQHFKRVCSALVLEVDEFANFLSKMETSQIKLKEMREMSNSEVPASCRERDIEDLRSSEWARLWMMTMRELRSGVTLKKASERNSYKQLTLSYEYTPYELLMQDIVLQRYQLRSVTKDDISSCLRKDAHEAILEFIRSRPPLKPVKPTSSNCTNPSVRERLMTHIQSRPKLRHIQIPNYNRGLKLGRVVEVSKSGAKKYDDKKLLLRPTSMDNIDIEDVSCTEDEATSDDGSDFESESSSETPVASSVDDLVHQYGGVKFNRSLPPRRPMERRNTHCHTVTHMPCNRSFPLLKNRLLTDSSSLADEDDGSSRSVNMSSYVDDSLSLTIQEVMHIRQVLAKAEMDNLLLNKRLYDEVKSEKVCFICKTNRFNLFRKAFRCNLCGKLVCKSCSRLVSIPDQEFLTVPIMSLSPAPASFGAKQPSDSNLPRWLTFFKYLSSNTSPETSPAKIRVPSPVTSSTPQRVTKQLMCKSCKKFIKQSSAEKRSSRDSWCVINKSADSISSVSGSSTNKPIPVW